MSEYGSLTAREIMAAYPAIDLHAHPLLWSQMFGYDLLSEHRPGRLTRFGGRHVDLPRLRGGLIGAQGFALVGIPCLGEWTYRRGLAGQLAIIEKLAADHPDELRLVRTAGEIESLRGTRTVAGLLGAEGAEALGRDPTRIADLARRGVRYLTLVHFADNDHGRPSFGRGADPDRGLTARGFGACFACWDNGVLVDLAHLNDKGFTQIMDVAPYPVIVSHTGLRAVHGHRRNTSDEQVRMIAKNGGVIGVMFARMTLGRPTIGAVVRHLDHLVAVGGEDVAAIGSDFDSVIRTPDDLNGSDMLPNLVDALLAGGWTEGRLAKLLRGNVLRVLGDVPTRT